MLISCNRLKSYIKQPDKIDWVGVWDKFSIRTAEVEGVEVKGQDIDGVVVAQILECEKVENSKKLHKLLVDNGKERLQVLCGAPNVRKGMKAPLVQVGGHVCGFEIGVRKMAGEESHGMMCSAEELGFAENCEGILELPEDFVVGKDIKEYLPIEDIIVEIDNKSLTNRPDLWGHFGIAREIAVITNSELLDLKVEEVVNNKDDLDIKIKSDKCLRYTGLKIANITNKKTPLDMQIFLYYAGMRCISLLVDLTNYIMLELGQPMHAFDARNVSSIEVDMANDKDKFTTLDGIEHELSSKMLMIKKNKEYYAIAGVMGGLDSEIKTDTDSIILESATFDAATIRRTATALGMRTEASARYEKSLDPNMTILATQRFVYLLKRSCPNIAIISNLTDIYPHKLAPLNLTLRKSTMEKYMGKEISADFVINTFSRLGFKARENKNDFKVIVPTFRATKDITLEADLIEEIIRLYGYENIELTPLQTKQNFQLLESIQEVEYEVKRLLATVFCMHEVHTYLWYKTAMLSKLNIIKDNIRLLGKTEDNILRDDLGLSLIGVAQFNLKNYNKFGIFEIGTEFINGENKRELSMLWADNSKNLETLFYRAKEVLTTIFKAVYNQDIIFVKATSYDYYNPALTYNIVVNGDILGALRVVDSAIVSMIAKKTALVSACIDFDKFVKLEKRDFVFENVSKYPTVSLDYTILMKKELKYEYLENILNKFSSPIIKEFKFMGLYEQPLENKYTIRFIVGSNDKTLTSEELKDFKNKFIAHIKKNGLFIIE